MLTRPFTRHAAAQGSELEARLFRRQDTPGHDACRLILHEAERRIEGAAVFTWRGMPTHLTYEAVAREDWRTRYGRVRGWLERLAGRDCRPQVNAWQQRNDRHDGGNFKEDAKREGCGVLSRHDGPLH